MCCTSKKIFCSVVSVFLSFLLLCAVPVTAFAAEQEKVYAVFYVDGEKFSATENTIGEPVIVPRSPEKEGYSFEGWMPKIPDVMPDCDMEFTAVFKPCRYDAVLTADGDIVKVITYTYGQKSIALPEIPEKAGYKGEWESYSLVAGGITIHAVYTCIAELSVSASNDSVNYGDDVLLSVKGKDLPEDSTVLWYVDDEEIGSGDSIKLESVKKSFTVTVKLVDANGSVLSDAEGNEIAAQTKVAVNSSIVARLLAVLKFLLRLFGSFSQK